MKIGSYFPLLRQLSGLMFTGLLCLGATNAQAVLLLDQQNIMDGSLGGQGIGQFSDFDGSPDPSGTSFDFQDAQTFTVGINGLLSQIDLPIFNTNGGTEGVTLDIRSVSGGIPEMDDSLVLGSVFLDVAELSTSVSPGDVSSWASVDISSLGIIVDVGDILAYSVRTDSTAAYLYNPEFGDTYSGGMAYRRNYAVDTAWGDFGGRSDIDFMFQTYVDTSAVPEPASVLLLGAGLIGMAQIRRRKGARNEVKCL